jgi:hypothetical protein
MHRLSPGGIAAALAAAAALVAAVLPPAAPASAASGNGCTAATIGNSWQVSCQAGAQPATTASSGGQQTCRWSSDVNAYFPDATRYLPAAGPGQIYLVQICGAVYGNPVLVNNGPAVTPAGLAADAFAQLAPPLPAPATAPPRGSDGLVGLPEWFWLPRAQWVPVTRRLAVGPVWAQVTATPSRLVIHPGGLPARACPGPGTAYNPRLPAAGQQSDCTYTFTQSSDGLPGNVYQVTVTITWTATWQGSGGTGGTLPALTRSATFALPVAEVQALSPGSS